MCICDIVNDPLETKKVVLLILIPKEATLNKFMLYDLLYLATHQDVLVIYYHLHIDVVAASLLAIILLFFSKQTRPVSYYS